MRLKLVRAAEWFIQYLMLEAPIVLAVSDKVRPHVRIWSDAAGATKWIAVVLLDAVGTLHWTRMQTPDWLLQVLLTRGDNYIGVQECLAFLLAIGTWPELVCQSRVSVFIDHLGVMYSFVKGRCRAPEVNQWVGRFWLQAVALDSCFYFARVASASNIADGPTRESLRLLEELQAVWREPVLPAWAQEPWAF